MIKIIYVVFFNKDMEVDTFEVGKNGVKEIELLNKEGNTGIKILFTHSFFIFVGIPYMAEFKHV